jgi:RecB family endonuclease NucS
MPIQHANWKVGDSPTPLAASRLATEQLLEDMIVREPRILSDEWLLIGRQERTPFGGIIDLLALAPDGSLVLIELKPDKTPRDLVAKRSMTLRGWSSLKRYTLRRCSSAFHRATI